MSEERDETRNFSPFDDATWAEDEAGAGRGRPGDRVRRSSRTPGERPGPRPATPLDATRVSPAADTAGSADGGGPADGDGASAESRGHADNATRVQPPAVDDPTRPQPRTDAPTLVDGPGARRPPDATSIMPAADTNPAWSGRAEVRPPQPGGTVHDQEPDWPAGPGTGQRDRWWMPIVTGTLVLVLLAALGWGVYRIVTEPGKNNNTPAPAVTTSALPAPSTAATAQTTEPSSAPVATTAAATGSTAEPTDDAVAIPALRGLTVTEAKSSLHDVGIDSTRVIYRASNAQPNTVLDSDPTEGQEVPADTTVTLLVAAPAAASPSSAGTGG